jgi:hypothetical protein
LTKGLSTRIFTPEDLASEGMGVGVSAVGLGVAVRPARGVSVLLGLGEWEGVSVLLGECKKVLVGVGV